MESWRYRRNRWLRERGFVDEQGWADYSAYVASAHWRRFRARYFECHEAKCWVCTKTDVRLVLHHLTYARMGWEWPEDVIPLCKRCHALVHSKATGVYVFKGGHHALKREFLVHGEHRLEKLYKEYIEYRETEGLSRKKRRQHRNRGRSDLNSRLEIHRLEDPDLDFLNPDPAVNGRINLVAFYPEV